MRIERDFDHIIEKYGMQNFLVLFAKSDNVFMLTPYSDQDIQQMFLTAFVNDPDFLQLVNVAMAQAISILAPSEDEGNA